METWARNFIIDIYRDIGFIKTLKEECINDAIKYININAIKILKLRYNDFMEYKDIATKCKLSEEEVKYCINKCKRIFNQHIKPTELTDKAKVTRKSDIIMLKLSSRSYNALYRHGARTVGKLILYNEKELLNIRNLGNSSINEIKEKLNQYGFHLRNY